MREKAEKDEACLARVRGRLAYSAFKKSELFFKNSLVVSSADKEKRGETSQAMLCGDVSQKLPGGTGAFAFFPFVSFFLAHQ